MYIEAKGSRKPIRVWTDEVEPQAMNQLMNVATLPWVFHHVAVMPDVHYGKGATVGSVIAMKDAVSPAAVGVDIGCGMAAVRTSLHANDLPDNLDQIRATIEAAVPVGFSEHRHAKHTINWLFNDFSSLAPEVQDLQPKAMKQLGTLGGGNHFIELCLARDGAVWLVLHSGSRNIGKCLAEIHISKAKTLAHNADLPDPDLAVFLSGTPEMKAYRRDLMWAQQYAFHNRRTMLQILKTTLSDLFPNIEFFDPIQCHHNYVSEEQHYGEDLLVTRKGAISARSGQLGIIPGSMGTSTYIVRGRGNPESFCSASHGAGRKLSRGAAKRTYTVDDLEAQTYGVSCRKDLGVLDEIPGAYKSIDQVMQNQKDLVEVVEILKQVLCVKG